MDTLYSVYLHVELRHCSKSFSFISELYFRVQTRSNGYIIQYTHFRVLHLEEIYRDLDIASRKAEREKSDAILELTVSK